MADTQNEMERSLSEASDKVSDMEKNMMSYRPGKQKLQAKPTAGGTKMQREGTLVVSSGFFSEVTETSPPNHSQDSIRDH